MKTRTHILIGLALFLWAARPALALSEFRAVTKQSAPLFTGPAESYPQLAASVTEGEVVLVIGTSTGATWLNVMKGEGTEGWVLRDKMELYKIPHFRMDDMERVLERKRRITSSWIVDVGTHLSNSPTAVGLAATIWWVPFKDGLVAVKEDQLEFGTGFLWGYRVNSNVSSKSYSEMPFAVQWMFRMPPRGSLMIGPKVGAALTQDSAAVGGSTSSFTFLGGATVRYFPYDDFGFYGEVFMVERGGAFITRQFGMSFRF